MCDPEVKRKMRCICGVARNWSEDEGEEVDHLLNMGVIHICYLT